MELRGSGYIEFAGDSYKHWDVIIVDECGVVVWDLGDGGDGPMFWPYHSVLRIDFDTEPKPFERNDQLKAKRLSIALDSGLEEVYADCREEE